MPRIIPPLLALTLLLPMATVAQVPVESDPRIEDDLRGLEFDSETWEEGAVVLPPYPEGDDGLIEVPFNSPVTGLEVLLDPDSLSLGEDRVSRYTVVIKTRSGARNVLFEGIQCNAGLYRVYAFGDGRGAFEERQSTDWRQIRGERGAYEYRRVLGLGIICDQYRQPRTPQGVISQLRYKRPSADRWQQF